MSDTNTTETQLELLTKRFKARLGCAESQVWWQSERGNKESARFWRERAACWKAAIEECNKINKKNQ